MLAGRRKGEEAQIAHSAWDTDAGRTRRPRTSATGRVRRGVGHQGGDTNGETGKNRVWERGTDGACVS